MPAMGSAVSGYGKRRADQALRERPHATAHYGSNATPPQGHRIPGPSGEYGSESAVGPTRSQEESNE